MGRVCLFLQMPGNGFLAEVIMQDYIDDFLKYDLVKKGFSIVYDSWPCIKLLLKHITSLVYMP